MPLNLKKKKWSGLIEEMGKSNQVRGTKKNLRSELVYIKRQMQNHRKGAL